MTGKVKAAAAFMTVMSIVWMIPMASRRSVDFRDPAFVMASDEAEAQPLDNWKRCAFRIGEDGPIYPCPTEDWLTEADGNIVRTDVEAEEQPATISNGHWRIPFGDGEMFDARVVRLWFYQDSKGKACKVEWTEEGMRFWCEDGRFDVVFGGGR